MEVVELFHGNQCMVTERNGSMLNTNLNSNRQTTETEQVQTRKSEVGEELE